MLLSVLPKFLLYIWEAQRKSLALLPLGLGLLAVGWPVQCSGSVLAMQGLSCLPWVLEKLWKKS